MMEQCYRKSEMNYSRAERRQIKKQYDSGSTQIEYPDGSISFCSIEPSPREKYLNGSYE